MGKDPRSMELVSQVKVAVRKELELKGAVR